MPKSPFPYPGGKFYQAEWILDYLPDHHCYVEPFGGAGAVLFTKDPSPVEVYNDKDDHVVDFFRTLWDDEAALTERLANIVYSRELHDEWAPQFYGDGTPPSDDVERAARFFFLRYSQQMAKTEGVSGFSSTRHRNAARKFTNAVEKLDEFKKRLSNVVIENKDYSAIVEQYDGEETVLYCDPPYDDSVRAYRHSDFDNDELASVLSGIEGRFILSCISVPESLTDECWIAARDTVRHGGNMHDGWEKKRDDELLVMNFDPEQTASFTEANQSALTAYE